MEMTSKTDMKNNEDYQKIWEAYIAENKFSPYVFLPLELGINEKGEIYRRRMKAGDIAKIWKGIKDKFPKYIRSAPHMFDNPDQIFGEYIGYFDDIDGNNIEPPRTPLDLQITHPTWIMFSLDNPNWKFCEHGAQYSVENDMDDLTRNYEKIALFDDPRLPTTTMHGKPLNTRKLLILANRNRSAPKGLKYNLHVDVLQTVFGKANSTTIIIDPGGGNNPNPPFGGGTSGGGPGGG